MPKYLEKYLENDLNNVNSPEIYFHKRYLKSLLLDLDGIEQNPIYHPEGDALFHSLQVFAIARQQSNDPMLWAAALFHDVGKAIDSKTHAQLGAEMLQGILHADIIWLIEHHLDLMINPKKTNQKYQQQTRLRQLQQLRRFDLAGRDPHAKIGDINHEIDIAFEVLTPYFSLIMA